MVGRGRGRAGRERLRRVITRLEVGGWDDAERLRLCRAEDRKSEARHLRQFAAGVGPRGQ